MSYSGAACSRRCEPRSYEVRKLSNRSGPFSVQVVRSCHANRHHCYEGCTRKPSYIYFFPNSKYQARIDIGKCIGICNNGKLAYVCKHHVTSSAKCTLNACYCNITIVLKAWESNADLIKVVVLWKN